MILSDKIAKGIKIGQEEFKITQFANDTTIFMDGSENSLQRILNILEVFGSLSGLKINTSKTKMIWIGKKRQSKEKLKCTSLLSWGTKCFNLLGIEDFDTTLKRMSCLDYNEALIKVDKTISAWKKHQHP